MSPELLDQIGDALEVELKARGFSSGERADSADTFIRRWVRDCTWKRDLVDLVYGGDRTRLTVKMSVEVPASGRHVRIDGTNAGDVAGRVSEYSIPDGWFRTLKLRQLADEIARDARAAVAWF